MDDDQESAAAADILSWKLDERLARTTPMLLGVCAEDTLAITHAHIGRSFGNFLV